MNDENHDVAADGGDEDFYRPEAADYLTNKRKVKTSAKSLAKYANTGEGPVYRLFGHRAVYTRHDLDAWADSKIKPPRKSTSARVAEQPVGWKAIAMGAGVR
jgi:hypothetical protein